MNFKQFPVLAIFLSFFALTSSSKGFAQSAMQDDESTLGDSSSAGALTLPAVNSSVFFTPENWIQAGSTLKTNCPGAYLKLGFSGSTFKIIVDSSAYVSRGGVAHDLPKIGFQVDGGGMRTLMVPGASSSVTMTLASGLSNGSHQVKVSLEGLGHEERWSNPLDQLKIKSFVIDSGASLSRPVLLPKRMVVYGDSITEGANTLGRVNEVSTKQWSTTWDALLAKKLNAEISTVAFQAQGYHNMGQGNVPSFTEAYGFVQAGTPRNFSRTDYVVVLHGTNGGAYQSEVTEMMRNLRREYPSAKIFFGVPFGQNGRDEIHSAYEQMRGQDSNLYLLDLGEQGQEFAAANSVDGIHPTPTGHAGLAQMLYRQVFSNR